MHCDDVRTILLDYGWDADERRRAALLLRHLDVCDACQVAFADYDALRHALRPTDGTAGAATGEGAHPEPPGGWDAFLEKVNPTPVVASDETLRLRPRPSGGRAAALAACVLLAAGAAFVAGQWAGSTTQVVVHAPEQPAPSTNPGVSGGDNARGGNGAARAEDTIFASLTPSPDDARRQASAFDQVSDLFDRKASWLMTSAGGASDVGLAPEPVPAGQKLLMLRLAVLHGGAVVSNADVVIVPGQSANLTLPMNDGRLLKYQIGTSAGEPTELTLWLEVQSPRSRGETLAALATNLRVRPGERVTAGELATTAGKYELRVGFTQAQSGPGTGAAGAKGRGGP